MWPSQKLKYNTRFSPDGKEEAQVLFKAGKNQEGYFMN
jgi:hypothetical protein